MHPDFTERARNFMTPSERPTDLQEAIRLLRWASDTEGELPPAPSIFKFGDGASTISSGAILGLFQLENEDPLTDSALAMLGYTAATLQPSLSRTVVRTLITLLSSSIPCGSQFFHCAGSAIKWPENTCSTVLSLSTVHQIVEYSLVFLRKSQVEETLASELLEVLVKLTSKISMLKASALSHRMLYEREDMKGGQDSKLASHIMDALVQFAIGRKEALYNRFGAYVRLLLWRFQREILMQDLSSLLQIVAERPLLILKNELRHRHEWHEFIIALVLGPDIFMEVRQILTAWLLATGAPCIWEVKAELCAAVNEVLGNPCSWDLRVEVGFGIPPLIRFYDRSLYHPMKILAKPPTWPGLQELVSMFEEGQPSEPRQEFGERTLQETLWATVMDFPIWLQFASLLLFEFPEIDGSGCSSVSKQSSSTITEGTLQSAIVSPQEISAKYIAWIFSPHDQKYREQVASMLMEMAKSWLCIQGKKRMASNASKESCVLKHKKDLVDDGETFSGPGDMLGISGCKPYSIHGPRNLNGTTVSISSCRWIAQQVLEWLLSFQKSRNFLDSYRCQGMFEQGAGIKHQAKRRLSMDSICHSGCTNDIPKQSVGNQSASSFLDTLPLVALTSSNWSQNESVVYLIVHYTMSCSDLPGHGAHEDWKWEKGVSAAHYFTDVYEESNLHTMGLGFREPSHRTEDFKDLCLSPLCSDPSLHAAWSFGVGTVFKFLESLDFLVATCYTDNNDSSRCLRGLKEVVAKQLIACIQRWSQQAGVQHLKLLDDLQQRASAWVNQAGLETETYTAFNRTLQSLDLLIATLLVNE